LPHSAGALLYTAKTHHNFLYNHSHFLLKASTDLVSAKVASAETAYEQSLGITPKEEFTASNATDGTDKNPITNKRH